MGVENPAIENAVAYELINVLSFSSLMWKGVSGVLSKINISWMRMQELA